MDLRIKPHPDTFDYEKKKAINVLNEVGENCVKNKLKRLSMKKITFDYDEKSDVMYINFGSPKPCKTIEPEETPGILIRYTLTGVLNGITIIDWKKRISKGE